MKKWIVRIVITLLALFLLIGLIPFSEEIHYSGTGYEFSLASDGAIAEHEIVIDGTYSSILFLKDRFWGTFYVSDVEGLTQDMQVNWTFEPNRWHHAYFQDYAGQAHSTEIVKIFFDRNFETVALQFATKYEKNGDTLSVAADNGKSNFLVLGAKNKEEALEVYARMLKEKQ
jgi:hypothetical protein